MPKAQFVTVSPAETGQKLLQFLERRLTGDVPRAAIQKWIRKGHVRVNKGRVKPFDRVETGQIVRIPPYTPGEVETVAVAGNLVFAYQDEHILAVAKPSGLAAHGGDKVDDSVIARLNARFAGSDFMPTLAHRLDRDTSGILLAALDYETLRTLNDLFASGNVDKIYFAWVRGIWKERGTIIMEDQIEKKGAPGNERVQTGSGKTALAQVTGLMNNGKYSLLAIRLLTGRTHQIRVQLASRKHPVVGDRKYGSGNERGAMRLHCYAIRFQDRTIHLEPPWTGRWGIGADSLREAISLLYD